MLATRTFSLLGGAKPVIISIGIPEPDPKSRYGDWRCPFRISGIKLSMLRYGYGVDAFQALISALQGIRSTLEPHRSKLSWIGDHPDLHLAFPRFIPAGIPDHLIMRIEQFIDDRVLEWVKRQERRAKLRLAHRTAARSHGKRDYR